MVRYLNRSVLSFSRSADSALLNNGKPFFIPDHPGRIEYETELVVRICKLGKTIPQRFAHRYYDAVTVGIDFTAERNAEETERGRTALGVSERIRRFCRYR